MAVLLSGCDRGPSKEELKQHSEKRRADVAAALAGPLQPRTIKAGAHEVIVIEVPYSEFGRIVSRQRCFVWRDAEFKTATMSCPGGSENIDIDQ
ncbi:hypothetical protein [Methylibium petroleiphilum]